MTWCLECRIQASLDRAASKRIKTSISALQYFVREFLKRQACHVPTASFLSVAGAYTAFIFARGNGASTYSAMYTAAFLGAVLGFSLGGMFANRAMRKRS
jgi:NhaP-type Na+/H+ or K+/H+ antiporter